jgi:hypothetical protein
MAYGYEVIVPMHFGAIVDPEQMVDFRAPRQALPAQPRVWVLDWADDRRRATLMPEEVAIHYFGNPESGPPTEPLVQMRKRPVFNDERVRVAQVWGDFLYSALHGNYTTVRIAVPRVPHVVIQSVDQTGQPLEGTEYRPWAFFDWATQLDPNHVAEMQRYHETRAPLFSPAPPPNIDLANLTGDQLDQLAEALLARDKKKKAG